jgi:hypothetical protein
MSNILNNTNEIKNYAEQEGFTTIETNLKQVNLNNEQSILAFLEQMRAYDQSLNRVLNRREIEKRRKIFTELSNHLTSICPTLPQAVFDIRDWYRQAITDMERVEGKSLDEKFFQQIPNKLINDVRDETLNPLDVVVYAVFLNFRGDNEGSWPSNTTVAKAVGRSERTIQHCTKRLEKAGHIDRSQYSNKGTKFTRFTTAIKRNRSRTESCHPTKRGPAVTCHDGTKIEKVLERTDDGGYVEVEYYYEP